MHEYGMWGMGPGAIVFWIAVVLAIAALVKCIIGVGVSRD